MNEHHCPSCGKFSTSPRRKVDAPRGDLLKAMQGERPPSEPHCRAERTKARKRATALRTHLQGWIDAGIARPKAVRLLGGGHG